MNKQSAMSRSEQRKIAFQDRIRDAALKLFQQNGITHTSVASIIKEADIAHKTFFNHFPSKDHLLEFLVSETMKSAFANLEFSETEKRDPKKQIEKSFLQITSAMANMDDGIKEVISYYFIGVEGPKDIRHEHTGNFHNYVLEILKQAKKNNQLIAGYNINDLAEIVTGLYSSTIMEWVSHDDYALVEKMKVKIKFINQQIFVD